MFKKVVKHIVRTIFCVILLLSVVTAGVQLIYYREKENVSVSEFDYIDENKPVYLTAHRGVTYYAPENSLPAFEKAAQMKYYAAECDIMLTKDNVWVLTHDDTAFLHFWSFKKVSENNYDSLARLTYKNGVNFCKFENLKIPTLEEYLDVLKNTDTKAQIEIKTEGTAHLDSILSLLEEKKMKDKSMIISFNINQLVEIRKIDKDIELWYLTEEINEKILADYRSLGEKTRLAIKTSAIPDEDIINAINCDVKLSAWTVNKEEDLKRVYELGINYITTDSFSY